MNITPAQRKAIDTFITELEGTQTLEQLLATGKHYAKESTVWRHIRQSASGQIKLVCWYNNTHRPGGQEWRPAVIIVAVLSHIGLPYSLTHTHQNNAKQPAH